MNYRSILIIQLIFIVASAIFGFLAFKISIPFFAPSILILILANLYFLKNTIFPSEHFLKKMNLSSPADELNWEDMEVELSNINKAHKAQSEKFLAENVKYKHILDSMEDPVCLVSPNAQIHFANSAFLRFFKLTDQQLPLSLVALTRNLEFQKFIELSLAQRQSSHLHYFSFNTATDAQKIYFDIRTSPIEKTQDLLCLFHDTTERRLADQMREDFVSNFSHEIRTPLAILNGQLELLKQKLEVDGLLGSTYQTIFSKIDKNSTRLINLFRDLLQLSSVEHKKDIQKSPFHIEAQIELLIQDIILNYPEKKIEYELNLESKIFFLDFHLFEQLLINIIDNAIKYSRDHCKLSIESRSEELWDVLTIKDNGLGIPEEVQHRIFERFFRVDLSHTNTIEGTGLGLSIVKHIMQKHDGRIRVQSKLNEGASFSFYFPRVS